jgi:hypothetical protein
MISFADAEGCARYPFSRKRGLSSSPAPFAKAMMIVWSGAGGICEFAVLARDRAAGLGHHSAPPH